MALPGKFFGAEGNDRQHAFDVANGTINSEGWHCEPNGSDDKIGGEAVPDPAYMADHVPNLNHVGRIGSGAGPMALPDKQTGFDMPAVNNC